MVRHWRRGLGPVLLLAAAAPAFAHGPACTLPGTIPVPRAYGPSAAEPVRDIPTAAHTLALSWAPQYCAIGEGLGGRFDSSFECDRAANRFGFILHGLWPDGAGREWPQYCRPASLLPPAVIRANLCMTPLADVLQNEWAKHGTCMSRSPERYFAMARAAYRQLRFPAMAALARDPDLTVGAFARAFLAANRGGPAGLGERSVRVVLARDGALQELRLCLDRRRRFAPCAANQGGGADAARKMHIRLGGE